MPTSYKNVNNLKVAEDLLSFVNSELLKDTDINPEKFWQGFCKATHELSTKNKELARTAKSIASWDPIIIGATIVAFCRDKFKKIKTPKPIEKEKPAKGR